MSGTLSRPQCELCLRRIRTKREKVSWEAEQTWCGGTQALESQPCLCLPTRQPSRAPLSLLSSICSPQWPQETVTRDGLALAHCQCLSLISPVLLWIFVVVVIVVDAARFS